MTDGGRYIARVDNSRNVYVLNLVIIGESNALYTATAHDAHTHTHIHTRTHTHTHTHIIIIIIIIVITMLSVAKQQKLLPSLDCCSPFISLLGE